jgi:small subunit ribosomal protein S9
MVNNIPVEKYFSSALFENIYSEPFKITNTQGRFTVDVKISGSGNKGQLKAMVHGIARALVLVDPEKNKTILRRRGLLTRDPRTRERRKIGHGGKARREKQSPKR